MKHSEKVRGKQVNSPIMTVLHVGSPEIEKFGLIFGLCVNDTILRVKLENSVKISHDLKLHDLKLVMKFT